MQRLLAVFSLSFFEGEGRGEDAVFTISLKW